MAFLNLIERSCIEPSRIPERDAANELYDHACELLAAAQGVRAAAGSRRSAYAIAATLGCVEASLEELVIAVSSMRVAALRQEIGAASATLERLARDLASSRSSCARARELVGPRLATN
jgi:hypothetical protein